MASPNKRPNTLIGKGNKKDLQNLLDNDIDNMDDTGGIRDTGVFGDLERR